MPQPLIDIGIPAPQREAIAAGLGRLLADSYTLLLKTHGYHWNVEGPMFNTLHEMFSVQYVELQTAVDEIAERIRALGVKAPGSLGAFAGLSSIGEPGAAPSAEQMIADLLAGNEAVVRTARAVLPLAQEARDESSTDLLIERMRLHEKTAWMLRSMLA
ncbi:MAG: Dps family protein [Gemmatimonadales bacterium]|nr:Dps family protein [Gemmatimonadales bacterium]